MNASQCHVLVITDNESSDSSLSLLHRVFRYVFYVPTNRDIENTLDLLRRQQKKKVSTLILIDSQSYTEDELFSTMSQFKNAADQFGEPKLHIAMVVYSSDTSADFMQRCLDHGAIDYIIKPLYENLVNMLFINLGRYRMQQLNKLNCGDEIPSHATVHESLFSNVFHNSIWSMFYYRLMAIYNVPHNPNPSVPRSISMQSAYIPRDIRDLKAHLREQQTQRSPMLIKTLSRWDFCPFKLVQTELIQSAFLITRHVLKLPGLEHINILDDALYDFLLDVANMYHELNPYHNFQHAVDVMQATFYFLCRMGILSPMDQDAYASDLEDQKRDYRKEKKRKDPRGSYPWIAQNGHINQLFTSLDALALLLASLGHDIGHPGLTNIFLVRTHTPLAMLYNDRSVLENFHATVFCNILQRHGFGANGGWLAPNDYGRFRKVIVQSILATDMGLHDDYVLKIQDQKMRLQKDALDPSHPQAAETDILLICGSLIKCADISNCSRPFPLAKKWAGILKEEFSEQGDLEKSLGLSVLPMHDRDETGLAKFQLAFKRNIAAKLFENVATTIPDMQYSVTILKSNCEKWEERLERKQGDKQPQDAATTVNVPAQSESASNPMQAPPDAPPTTTETKQALNGASAPMTPSTTVVSTANIAFKPTIDGGSVPDKVAPVVKTKKKKNKCVIQ